MILDQFRSKLVEFTKSQQTDKLDVLRFFLAEVKNKEIELRPQGVELNDEHIFKVLRKLIKQINEAIEMYEKGGRADALNKARGEKVILEEFVKMFPAEMIEQAQKQQQQYQRNA